MVTVAASDMACRSWAANGSAPPHSAPGARAPCAARASNIAPPALSRDIAPRRAAPRSLLHLSPFLSSHNARASFLVWHRARIARIRVRVNQSHGMKASAECIEERRKKTERHESMKSGRKHRRKSMAKTENISSKRSRGSAKMA